MDAFESVNYETWLQAYIKPCYHVLCTVAPQFQASTAHQLRHTVLELLNRMPQSDFLKATAGDIFQMCIGVVRADNQDNSLIAIKIMFDMLKMFKVQLEKEAEGFQELVVQVRWSNPCCTNQMAITPLSAAKAQPLRLGMGRARSAMRKCSRLAPGPPCALPCSRIPTAMLFYCPCYQQRTGHSVAWMRCMGWAAARATQGSWPLRCSCRQHPPGRHDL